MGSVNFESILTKKHHYWRNLIILFVVAAVIGSYLYVETGLQPSMEEEIMTGFITESLKEAYQPETLTIREQTNEINQKIYKADWTSDNVSFHATIYYANGIPDLILAVEQPELVGFDKVVSQAFASRFFKSVEDNWNCIVGEYTNVCESSWLVGEEKNFAAIQTIKSGGNSKSILYSCKGVIGSSLYERNACAILR